MTFFLIFRLLSSILKASCNFANSANSFVPGILGVLHFYSFLKVFFFPVFDFFFH